MGFIIMASTSMVLHICVFTIFCISSIAEASLCSGSYTYQNEEFCYAFVSEAKTWFDAQTVCKAIGGYLAEIKTEEQNLIFEGILYEHPGVSVWLGATDLVEEGKWYWATSDIPLSEGFTYWIPGEPNNAANNENCLEFLDGHRRWNDRTCNTKRAFVCQKPVQPIVG